MHLCPLINYSKLMRNKCKNIYKIKRELVDEKGKTRSTIET